MTKRLQPARRDGVVPFPMVDTLPVLVLFVALLVVPLSAHAEAFDCVLEPALSLKLGSPVQSILDKVEVDRGDLVTEGQEVARLETAVEATSVAVNRAKAESTAEIGVKQVRVELTRLAENRQMTLQEHNFAAGQKVEESKADFEMAKQELVMAQLNHRVAELELQRAQATLQQRVIRSPITGIVTQRTLGPGEYVHQDAHIMTIAKIDPLNVETFLPIAYYSQVKVNDVATVRPNDPVGGDYPAKISVIDRVFDAASGTFGVRLILPNPKHLIPAGLRCRVNFAFSGARPETGQDQKPH